MELTSKLGQQVDKDSSSSLKILDLGQVENGDKRTAATSVEIDYALESPRFQFGNKEIPPLKHFDLRAEIQRKLQLINAQTQFALNSKFCD